MRRTIAALFCACALSPLVALDFGLDVTNDTEAVFEAEVTMSQEDRATLWLSLPIGSFSSLYASGYYEFAGDYTYYPAYADAIVPYSFNAGRVEWEGALMNAFGPATGLRWSAGRIPLSDASGRVVSGLFDGALAEFCFGNLFARVSAGYAGLLFKDEAKVLLDADDIEQWADAERLLAPKRLLAELQFKAAEMVPGWDGGLDAWGQFDLEGAGNVATHTAYAIPFVEGRLGRALRLRAWGAAEFGWGAGFFMAQAAGVRLRLSLPEYLGLRVTQSLAWASGDTDGDGLLRAFSPIVTGSLATVSDMPFSDSAGASLELAISPTRGLSVGAGGEAVFRSSLEDRLDVLRDDATSIYLGSEAALRLVVTPVNDASLSLTGGAFFPNDWSAYPDGTPVRYLAAVSATIRF